MSMSFCRENSDPESINNKNNIKKTLKRKTIITNKMEERQTMEKN